MEGAYVPGAAREFWVIRCGRDVCVWVCRRYQSQMLSAEEEVWASKLLLAQKRLKQTRIRERWGRAGGTRAGGGPVPVALMPVVVPHVGPAGGGGMFRFAEVKGVYERKLEELDLLEREYMGFKRRKSMMSPRYHLPPAALSRTPARCCSSYVLMLVLTAIVVCSVACLLQGALGGVRPAIQGQHHRVQRQDHGGG